jgi:glutamyl-Q tRNA(Asp) synthetase
MHDLYDFAHGSMLAEFKATAFATLNRSSMTAPYRGRFAPTPSGPLHLGSLLTALASYLEARQAGGRWLLRIDDLDTPRCRPEHVDTILRQLHAHGLHWDESPRRQSEHLDEYRHAVERLAADGLLYRCRCTRAELAVDSPMGVDGPVYAGTCRNLALTETGTAALRIRLADGEPLQLVDRWQGHLIRDRQSDIGDFVVRRSDRQIGYQLACVIDDLTTGITDVVRGADLISSSLRQMVLFEQLGQPSPRYEHLPILTGPDGRKLSKQNHAAPINAQHAMHNLQHCLTLLGQNRVDASSVSQLIAAAIEAWNPVRVPTVDALPSVLSS